MKWTHAAVVAAALVLVTGSAAKALIQEVIVPDTAGARSNVKNVQGFTINGVATLLYTMQLPGDPQAALYEAQRIGGAWTTQKVFQPADGATFLGATYVGGTLYAGVTTYGGGGFRIMSTTGGSWQTQYQVTGNVGDCLSMATVNGEPVAVYSNANTNGYSPSATILERTVGGNWVQSSIPTPQNAGIWHTSVRQIGSDVAVLCATYGNFGDFLVQRSGGTGGSWTTHSYSFTQDLAGTLIAAPGTGQAAFISAPYTTGSAPFSNNYNVVTGPTTLSMTSLTPTSQWVISSDVEVINNVVSVAYIDRVTDLLHYGELHGSTFTNLTLGSAYSDWTDGVTVFQGPSGAAAIGYYYYEPNGSISLSYVDIAPEPASVGFLIAGAAGLLLQRRKRHARGSR